jgi:hypothetical protein
MKVRRVVMADVKRNQENAQSSAIYSEDVRLKYGAHVYMTNGVTKLVAEQRPQRQGNLVYGTFDILVHFVHSG